MSLTANRPATITATLKSGGATYPVPLTADVSVRLYASNGATPITATKPLLSSDIGANWLAGVVVASFSAAETAAVTLPYVVAIFTVSVEGSSRNWSVQVDVDLADESSALFPSRVTAVGKLRRDRLMMLARSVLPGAEVSDDYLWDKLRAAESEMAHELRVPLAPTAFFPSDPTPEQIAALNGKPWGIDPGYDYHPSDFQFNDKWGMIKLRNKPLQSVSRIRFAYPGGPTAHYDLPLDWLRVDKKYGMVQFVPSSTAFAAPLNAFVMQAIGNGRIIPLAIQISYVAGLDNVAANYPELLDAVMKKAAIKILEDAFLPQSGSISADGLSQSMSVDMDKYHDSVDRIINGGKGSNGGLMTAIHGVRVGVMGG